MRIVEKLIGFAAVAISCFAAAALKGGFFSTVAVSLISVTALLICETFADRPRINNLISAGLSVSCFMIPQAVALRPAAVFILSRYRSRYAAPFAVVALISTVYLSFSDAAVLIALTVSAAVIGILCFDLESCREKLIGMRDDNAEKQELLKEQNSRLVSIQDFEVRAATLNERNRIAREIHDSVGHMLSRSILQVGALKVITKEKETAELLDSLGGTLDTAMSSIRRSVHKLHEDSVDLRASFAEALKTLDGRFKVESVCDISSDCPYAVKLSLINIAREAVSNTIKHSNGDRVYASLKEHPSFYQFIFEDNGTSAIGKKLFSGGIGLQNIRDRISALGGLCRFDTGKGFRIFITVPKRRTGSNAGSYS